MNDADLPPELAACVGSELRNGQCLVWVGQPRPGLYAKASGCLLVVGIFFTAFSHDVRVVEELICRTPLE